MSNVAVIQPKGIANKLQPASFWNATKQKNSRHEYAVNSVVKLLHDKIQKSEPVTLEDIKDLYLNYIFRGEVKTVYRKALDWMSFIPERTGIVDRQIMKEKHDWYLEYMGIDFFKKNLGSAIMKGKLLVIPIIEI